MLTSHVFDPFRLSFRYRQPSTIVEFDETRLLTMPATATRSEDPTSVQRGYNLVDTIIDALHLPIKGHTDLLFVGFDASKGIAMLAVVGLRITHGRSLRHCLALYISPGYTMPDQDARCRGDLDTALTSIHPYLRYAVTERLDVWGLLGYGWGDLTLQPGAGSPLETDTNLVMGSFGGRGILLQAEDTGGFQLATRTDAMLTRTTSDAVTGDKGNLASSEADAHRLRLILEGTRGFTWDEGRTLTPTLEVGLRHDWGDAETGFGVELGSRVQYADPRHGLTVEFAVRGLLAHEDSDYEEWGASGSLRIAPGPMGQGLALTLSPTWGAASRGVESLWSRQTTAGLATQGRTQASTGRLNAQVGYGLWLPSAWGMVTPFTGVSVTDGDGWQTRAGLVFDRLGTWGSGLRVGLAGESRTTAVGQSEQTIGLQLQFTFGSSRHAAQDNKGRSAKAKARSK